jgi:demethylmenaquinone methyltransferase/2-methoxy-6-polyprenyl-1,4-benzoquinol methylase
VVEDKKETRDLYRRRAGHYDRSLLLFRPLGIRLAYYRRATVAALSLKPGDSVVELGCGTGLNFPWVQEAIGPTGRLTAVDLTDAMLDVARERVARAGWKNVDLVQADLAEWQFPAGMSGVYSTFVMSLIPEYGLVIERASQALKKGGRLAVMDFKEPVNWPRPLRRLAVWLNKPYGVNQDVINRHPWESIRRHLTETEYKEFYFGTVYLCAGERVG